MPEYGRFTAWICCDDAPLEEYGAERKHNTVSCWIASEVDQEFSIMVDEKPGDTDTQIDFEVDGAPVRTLCGSKSTSPRQYLCQGAREGAESIRPFVFSSLILVDDDSLLSNSNSLKAGFGTIRVEVFRVVAIRTEDDFVDGMLPELHEGPIHERAKKIGSHRIGLGAHAVPVERSKCYIVEPLDPDAPDPIAVFEFKYRSKEFLMAQGIAPRPEKVTKRRRPGSRESSKSQPRKKVLRRQNTGGHSNIGSEDDDSEQDDEPPKGQSSVQLMKKKLELLRIKEERLEMELALEALVHKEKSAKKCKKEDKDVICLSDDSD